MRVIIREEHCIGCGVCVSMCPGVFSFDSEGKVKVIIRELPGALEHDCRQTVLMCPGEAIEFLNVA